MVNNVIVNYVIGRLYIRVRAIIRCGVLRWDKDTDL